MLSWRCLRPTVALPGTTHVRNDVAVFELDGPLASVWAEYSFYAGEKFSHCGIDAFQLAQVTTLVETAVPASA
jgi:hypothetical protein